jgi:chorismate--pyruvate lyase
MSFEMRTFSITCDNTTMQKNRRLTGWIACPAPSVSKLQREWLTRPGALTQGLRQLGTLRLRVLSERVCRASDNEAARLGLHPGSALWQREVCMSVEGVDCVVAHSVASLTATQGHWQALRRLRNRPLADILYQDRTIVRSDFEFTTLALGMPLYRLSQLSQPSQLSQMSQMSQAAQPLSQRVLARRSVFERAGQPLLVAEAFLPAFWILARKLASRRCS